eukprot:CAMPEP_0170625320 /NCGR_PEP_ID=MMETSP0224-20130122/30695_1 /TAXON_ID=285029 /ORGANISM="Togula jolla, Strain CCCM 725" /LENGTH=200 /DNA_ID=CAMNT_0010951885 /DNA_START=335 /DNA_END=934 /DNA_ORIENTATION=-
MRQVGHCFVPVCSIHFLRLSSASKSFFWRSSILPCVHWLLCSSQLRFQWNGCAPQVRQDSFLQSRHFNLGSSPSVGQAHMSLAADTACSRLRARRRSMISAGSSFLRSRSAMSTWHSGHATLASPSSSRALACRRMQSAQYQPCWQLRQTARNGGAVSQHNWQVSTLVLMHILCGLELSVDMRMASSGRRFRRGVIMATE